MKRKRCFVIAPIGENGTSTRTRSDQILNYVIRPIATKFGYDVTRADEITEPGIISSQILERIINDPLVIADLTERNPNVYYELAVRHAVNKPVIQLIQNGEILPFDVAGNRTIFFDYKDLDSVEDAKKKLAQYIENIESSSPSGFESPISFTLNLQALRASSDPHQNSLVNILERMAIVDGNVLSIQESQKSMDSGLSHQLDRLLRVVVDMKDYIKKDNTEDAVSDLNTSVKSLRTRLIEAITDIFKEVQEQHTELAKKIQSVFEEQSETATDTVKKSFSDEIAMVVPDNITRNRLLERLVKVFMDGMKSMGIFQQINVTEETESSTHAIQERINKSIEEVFNGIDNIEDQVTALPLPSQKRVGLLE